MTEILTFPPKKHNPPEADVTALVPAEKRHYSPEGALEHVLRHMRDGDTKAITLIIAWVESEDDDIYAHRYMVGGDGGLAATVGLLEITKAELLTE